MSYGGIGEKCTVRNAPGLEHLVLGSVWVVFGDILPRVLLGKGPLETLERVRVKKVVGVVWFAWGVVRHGPGSGGGWG